MTTIFQLPSADAVSASDLVPISQGGSVHSISVGLLLSQTQPAIIVEPLSLLGRISIGPGGPDKISLGDGLKLTDGTLSADSFDIGALPVQTELFSQDRVIITNSGTAQVADIDCIRDLFKAGANISIDGNGVISAHGTESISDNHLSTLPTIQSLSAIDLIGVSHDGEDQSIHYGNFLDGLTIDQGQTASLPADEDTFWVAQSSNVMVRQDFGAIWSWISARLQAQRRPAVELSADTNLDGTIHNNAILICSSPISIFALYSNLGHGFSCDVINCGSGMVTFSGNIVASSGLHTLAPNQSGSIACFTYSGGDSVYLSISAASPSTVTPGPVSGVATSSLSSGSISLSWSAPTSGGAVSAYTVQYRVTGAMSWIPAGQNGGQANFTIVGLQPSTSYDFSVIPWNNVGAGPSSSILTVTMLAMPVLPGPPTAVSVSATTANSITCSWTAPMMGGTELTYLVQYRMSGESIWTSIENNVAALVIVIPDLNPATNYEIQVSACNQAGSGPSSVIVSTETQPGTGSVVSMVWNVAPVGSFIHGIGAIGINVHVNPGTAPVQFGFSISSAVAPTVWVIANLVNTDLWGAYVPTPASAGSWYGWVEALDGSARMVYPNPFTVT